MNGDSNVNVTSDVAGNVGGKVDNNVDNTVDNKFDNKVDNKVTNDTMHTNVDVNVDVDVDVDVDTDVDADIDVHTDILIIGGGLVGASLAAALARSSLSVALVEAKLPADEAHSSFDSRTVALTDNARRIFRAMGVWDSLGARACAIREILVCERGGFGMAHLRAHDVGCDALGHVVANRDLGRALYQVIRQTDSVRVFCPARVDAVAVRGDSVVAEIQCADGVRRICARLAVRADGVVVNKSDVRSDEQRDARSDAQSGEQSDKQSDSQSGERSNEQRNQQSDKQSDAQSAIVGIVRADCAHDGRAYERFTAEGPIALLPYTDSRRAFVWTCAPRMAATRMALTDDAFIAALQSAFGDRAGNFIEVGARRCYPLSRARRRESIGARTVIIGNAAHTLHPVAGQGFNLGLRDVAVLAEMLCDAALRGDDVGALPLLQRYARARSAEVARVCAFTDGLLNVFAGSSRWLRLARNVGLLGVELLPPVKRALLRRTMGMAGARTRLGVGLPLVNQK